MIAWLLEQNPIFLAFLGTSFTFLMTLAGSALVFFVRTINQKIFSLFLGLASGVMISASFFSLILPAINHLEGENSWLIALSVAGGFVLGGGFLFLADKLIPHMHIKATAQEGPKSKLKRTILLVFSVTIHNIPEGLAVGVAFGSIVTGDVSGLLAAIGVAIGIGIQNFPEGAIISIPLRAEGISKKKAFLNGALSGIVEPIAGVLGALMVFHMQKILPWALSFAAGAMIYVVCEELIPSAKEVKEGQEDNGHFMILGVIIGFVLMMILDVALG
ncbi:MAG: ZIP family metal transporter [Acholeplasmatales bacterium]|jgi:ZIP family zinc transporter|nr:ZIP family metal transporter [Acholeplasmatales bacterium]